MSIIYTEHPTLPVVEITVLGKVTAQDFDTFVPRMEAFLERHGEVRFIEIVKEFKGFDWSSVWDGIKFDFKHMHQFTHVAVVSDIGWIGPMSRAFSRVSPVTLRTFALDEVDAARAWIENPDA